VTDLNRRARYYRLTARGEAELEHQTTWWLRYAETLTDILMDEPETA
jgi:DNA-binding PadR family transcriptional regulator